MAKLFFVPIEPFEERYSTQWLAWFEAVLAKTDCFEQVLYIEPTPISNKITSGEFLDVIGTNHYKSKQMQRLLEYIHKGEMKSGDIVFFMDAWFPGMEMLAYVRDGMKLNIKLTGCLHAGTWDPEDFLTQQGMGKWAKSLEDSWLKTLDLIFVATNFHKDLICQNRNVIPPSKIKVTGFPIYEKEITLTSFQPYDVNTKLQVVFPHRLAKEKHPTSFEDLMTLARNKGDYSLNFVKTKDAYEKTGKKGYYKTLDDSLFAVSFATQETWGIAMQEAVICGCLPIVPDRLSYSEMYLDCFKYNCDTAMPDTKQRKRSEVSNAYHLLNKLMRTQKEEALERWKVQKHLIISKGRMAIPLMIQHMLQELT